MSPVPVPVTLSRVPVRAALLLAPALLVMALVGLLPVAIVIFYSFHDTFAGNAFLFVGLDWYRDVLTSPEFHGALGRSLLFTALTLMIQMPLGLVIALRMPGEGRLASVLLVVMAVPLLVPHLVVGYLWKAMTLPSFGLLSAATALVGGTLDMNEPWIVWSVLLAMDAWHWTSLVVLLAYAGLRTVPPEVYRAARIDGAGRFAIFRHVEWPRLRLVLFIAFLLRFMDSLVIYTEAYVVTRGGPDVSTTFLSVELVQVATIQFDLGRGGAMAVIYLGLVLLVTVALFRVIMPRPGR